MRSFLFVLILFTMNLAPVPVRAESAERRAALKLCRQKYRDAIKGARYLKGTDKRARMKAAREERRQCRALAPAR
jgi:hypothetical protein